MASLVIYFAVFIIADFLLSYSVKYRRLFNFFSIVGLIILIMFAAGRYHVGTDIGTYTNIFIRYANYSWTDFFSKVDSEFLYAIIAKITWTIGGRVLTWGVFAALITIPVYSTLKKQYPAIYIDISIYIFLFAYYATAFNVTRQFIAVSLIFWGMKYVFSNKFIPFLIIVLLATGFHITALVGVFIWFFWDHKNDCAISGRKAILIVILTAAVVWAYQSVIIFLSGSFSFLATYASYAETSTRGSNRNLIVSLVELAIFLFLWIRNCYKNANDERLALYILLIIISTLIEFTGFTHPHVKRMAYYFVLPARLILFGYLPYCFSDNSQKVVKILSFLWVAGLFVLTSYVLGESNIIPYQFDLFSAC